MRLKSRLLVIVGIAWLCFLGVVYLGTDFYLLKHIKSNENNEINYDLSRISKSLNQRLNNLGSFTSDWGYWNDAYDYIEGKNSKFISENINLLVLNNSNINLLLYLNKQGKVLIGISTDIDGNKLKPFPKKIEKYIYPDSSLVKNKEAIKSKQGLIYVQDCIILVASAAVSNTDKSKPINGTIITGRYLTKKLLESISYDTELELILYLPNDIQNNVELRKIFNLTIVNGKRNYIVYESKKLASAYLILQDFNKKPIAIIKAIIPRTTYIAGIKAITYYLIMLFILGLLLGFIIFYFLNTYVLERVEKLANKIQDIDEKKDYTARLLVNTDDELSSLSQQFNKMMDTIQQSSVQQEHDIAQLDISKIRLESMNKRLINEINERKQIEDKVKKLNENLVLASRRVGMVEIANSVLYGVRDILNNIVTNVEDTKCRLKKTRLNSLKILEKIHKDLESNFNSHPKMLEILDSLEILMKSKSEEYKAIFNEVNILEKNIDHIKNFILMQKSLSGVDEINEEIKLGDLINDSILLNKPIYKKFDINIKKDFEYNEEIIIDRVKLLYVLVSLIRNAIQLLLASNNEIKNLTIATKKLNDKHFTILISYNGIGISPENIKKMFSTEYLEEQNEDTFNIHKSVIFTHDMGGNLTAQKMDFGQGTIFTIVLPIHSSIPNTDNF